MSEYSGELYGRILEEHGGADRENLFELFGKIQDAFGCVPGQIILELCSKAKLPISQIYGALTSYPFFEIREGPSDGKRD